ncbi:hypothetical protein METHB2_390015 [Candidatus Methylobacter favarea]|uniref:Uncharacterized protein n=1 Tax=Candidatus Methylobacter favarea TaxID=2707345 RepID=A0A8S0YA83_9GAMM|nr:hypothetical protein [Candidatus Methylobacter favarea]CAA9891281.1 hypothetical protein METHB2_390015 [Candidatus Methylobacter favarea]
MKETADVYSAQKAKIAIAAVKSIKTINEITQEHSIRPSRRVSPWKKDLSAKTGSLLEGKRGPKPINVQSDPEHSPGLDT